MENRAFYRDERGKGSLARYLRDIAHSEPLSHREEAELARQIRAGSQEARDKLVMANLRYVVSVAREYRNCGVPLGDLTGVGNVGLMAAAERFDGTRGIKFISYAVWWIRQAILQALATDPRVVRLPTSRIELLRNIYRILRESQQTEEAAPEMETIARDLDVSVKMVEDTLMLGQEPWSLDAPFESEDDFSLAHVLPDALQRSPDAGVIEESNRDHVERMLGSLKEREAQVLRLYLGLGDQEALTLEEIGARFRLSRERVRQIKESALEKLRSPSHRVQIEALMESV